jgi:hypothetical protein
VTERFDTNWLRLREPFDHAARSVALARRLAERLPARPRLVDLGAGTGSLFRFLAPIIGRGQDWLLVDADADLLDEAFGCTAAWARRHGFAATSSGDTLNVSTPHGLWRIQTLVRDLTPATTSSLTATDALVCSALLDLVSSAWLRRLLETLCVPLLACVTVDGRNAWMPGHSNDPVVYAAFRRDQRQDKGFGPALGIDASAATLKVLAARGFMTSSAPADWHVPHSALSMQRALIDGTADAARTGSPWSVRTITQWQETRLRQALRGRLAIRIGHRDILALPRGG